MEKNKPTIVCLRTTIGYGSKVQGTHGVHGSRRFSALSSCFYLTTLCPALKADDIQLLKTKYGFPPDKTFYIPAETYEYYDAIAKRGAALESAWDALLA